MHALQRAAALPPAGAQFISQRLYHFHSLPRTPRPLVLLERSRFAGIVGWSISDARDDPWLRFERRGAGAPRWKLYLSPFPDRLEEVALAALPILASTGAQSVKLGREAGTLLRPDRFVAYFPQHDLLLAAADELRPLLATVPAHGVPFTAQLDLAGLLSWGLDPTPTAVHGRSISWRSHVTRLLGKALFLARRSGRSRDAAVRFALRRLAVAGVDSATFAPRSRSA